MPDKPITRGDVALLAQQVGVLQREVHDAIIATGTALRERPTQKDIQQARKRFVVWGLVILALASLLNVGTFTVIASKCFLEVPKGALYSVCSVIPGYDGVQKENKKNIDQFHILLNQIPQNSQALHHQQREIRHLKAVLRKHHIKP